MRHCILGLLCCVNLLVHAQGEWKTLRTGAGGWITGLSINPNDGHMVARSDVGGAYLYNASANNWSQIVTSESMPADEIDYGNYQGVLSIVSAPSDSRVLYMAYGQSVYRSNDGAITWTSTNYPEQDQDPNSDDSKLSGERLSVDPLDEDIVYFGSINNGLWRAEDGQNWSKINAIPDGTADRGVRTILFHEETDDVLKASTIYVFPDGENIYQSQDGGNSWTAINNPLISGASIEYLDAEIDENGHIYIVGAEYNNGSRSTIGMMRYDGSQWTQLFTDNPTIILSEIAIDPFDNNRIFLFSEGFQETYRSFNGSSNSPSWTAITSDIAAPNIPWLAWIENDWFTLGEVVFDPIQADKLWISHGTGTYYSTDLADDNMIWTESAVDQEHLVSNDAMALPDGRVLTAHWDFAMFDHSDLDEYPQTQMGYNRFNSVWDFDYTPADNDFLVAVIEDHRFCCYADGAARNSSYSTDGGASWTPFASNPGDEFDMHFGTMAIAAENTDNIIWLPAQNKSPFYTKDRGATWTEITLPNNSGSCCHGGFFLKRRALTADRVEPATFYIYDWGNGTVYKTTDGGENWSAQVDALPAWSWHGKLMSVPDYAGHLLFVNGPEENRDLVEGLLRSTDGGQSFTEMTGTDEVLNVAIGKAAPGSDYPTLYILGKVNDVYGYWMSTDEGSSWQNIGTYPLGIYADATVMEGDMHNYGRLIVGFSGNGFMYYQAEALLPVSIISFTADIENQDVLLSWQTASEINTDVFNIQRSIDTEDWKDIGAVQAAGNSSELLSYTFRDAEIFSTLQDKIYYRLETIDRDGSLSYSEVISVEPTTTVLEETFEPPFNIYPNPVHDLLNVTVQTDISFDDVRISLYDIRGVIIIDQPMTAATMALDITEHPDGLYYISIQGSDINITKELIKS